MKKIALSALVGAVATVATFAVIRWLFPRESAVAAAIVTSLFVFACFVVAFSVFAKNPAATTAILIAAVAALANVAFAGDITLVSVSFATVTLAALLAVLTFIAGLAASEEGGAPAKMSFLCYFAQGAVTFFAIYLIG